MHPSRTRNYLTGLLTGYTATFVTVAVGLWLTPFVLRFLDRGKYAIFEQRCHMIFKSEKAIDA